MGSNGLLLVLDSDSPSGETPPSSSEIDDLTTTQSVTPSQSGEVSPLIEDDEPLPPELVASGTQKKKKKKKSKKNVKAKEAVAKAKAQEVPDADGKPSVLCISRNKHWRYISSYHVRVTKFSQFCSPRPHHT